MKKKLLIVLGFALGAVLAAGGYSLGATTSSTPVDTACVTHTNVLSHIYAKSVSCPTSQYRFQWDQQGTPFSTVRVPSTGTTADTATATCAAGAFVVGGGYSFANATGLGVVTNPPAVVQNGPNGRNGWTVSYPSPGGSSSLVLTVTAVCAK